MCRPEVQSVYEHNMAAYVHFIKRVAVQDAALWYTCILSGDHHMNAEIFQKWQLPEAVAVRS